MSTAEWLVVLGGAFELGGLVALAIDLGKTRREVARYERRPHTVRLGLAGEIDLAAGIPSVTTGREPTVEERIRSLETRVERLQTGRADLVRDLKAKFREDLQSITRAIEEDAKERFEAVESLLKGVTVGGLRLRVVGAGLVLVGIVLSVAGNLL